MGRATIFTAVSAVLLTVSMVFLILGMVASPVSTSLKLASTKNYTYGIFGYCRGSSCPSASYPVSFGDVDKDAGWKFATSTRNTLAKTFIVAPIAAGLSFLATIFTVLSFFAGNSAIKIFSLVFGVISFVATALVAVMVVLVFYPNTSWTGWLYVAAAGLSLLAVPCLLLSIRVFGGDEESEAESEKNFGTYAADTSLAANPLLQDNQNRYQFSGPPVNNYTTDDVSSYSKDYSYRAATGTTYSANKNGSHASLFDSKPHLVNDITQPNNVPVSSSRNNSNASNDSYYEDAPNFNQGPSTPISSKQKMAPNFIPNVAIPANNSGYKPVSGGLPYPKSERGSTAYGQDGYNGVAMGVFDHHPNVEGHQPFTELGDNDGESPSPTRQIDSDEDSDFTSVSQRPPNDMYQQARPQQFQQQYPNVANYQPQYQQNQAPPTPSSYYGSEGTSYNPHYQLSGHQQQPFQSGSGYQQQPFQGNQFQQQKFGQVPPRPQNKPTVSDSILNNNPDFAIGGGQRRKQFVPPSKRYGNPMKPQQRPSTSSRDGPYGML